jgi:hypothetical protein
MGVGVEEGTRVGVVVAVLSGSGAVVDVGDAPATDTPGV